jgi:hypothetical protein
VTQPTDDDVNKLNKRLTWQRENPSQGLTFVPLDTEGPLRLVVFTDSSFANNSDYSSQIGYVIVLADEKNNANIIHWSSTKCKRVTRSTLASELYGMATGFDVGAAIKATLEKIMKVESLPLILCTDSKSLYECLVKLGMTHEKQLMIDIMCLRQSYERREISEVVWIDGDSNPTDAMTKAHLCQVLRDLIDTNRIDLRVTGWVERGQEGGTTGAGNTGKQSPKTKSSQCVTPCVPPAHILIACPCPGCACYSSAPLPTY